MHLIKIIVVCSFIGYYLIACEGTGFKAGKTCQKVGQQCRLDKVGELGVCSPLNEGQQLICMPQH